VTVDVELTRNHFTGNLHAVSALGGNGADDSSLTVDSEGNVHTHGMLFGDKLIQLNGGLAVHPFFGDPDPDEGDSARRGGHDNLLRWNGRNDELSAVLVPGPLGSLDASAAFYARGAERAFGDPTDFPAQESDGNEVIIDLRDYTFDTAWLPPIPGVELDFILFGAETQPGAADPGDDNRVVASVTGAKDAHEGQLCFRGGGTMSAGAEMVPRDDSNTFVLEDPDAVWEQYHPDDGC
jgi:hypothetical protein